MFFSLSNHIENLREIKSTWKTIVPFICIIHLNFGKVNYFGSILGYFNKKKIVDSVLEKLKTFEKFDNHQFNLWDEITAQYEKWSMYVFYVWFNLEARS